MARPRWAPAMRPFATPKRPLWVAASCHGLAANIKATAHIRRCRLQQKGCLRCGRAPPINNATLAPLRQRIQGQHGFVSGLW